jgi:hypothetical protein
MTWLLLLLVVGSALHAATITLADYTATLTRIRSFVAEGRIADARSSANALVGSDIDSPNGRFKADSTLLAEIASAKPGDLGVEARIDATLNALRTAAPTKPRTIDQPFLERLRREQTVPELARGGDIEGLRANGTLLHRIGDAIRKAARWTVDLIVKFFDWLARFWPKDSRKNTPATAGIGKMVSVLVGLIVLVLGILAFEVIRRSRKARASLTQESAPVASSRDDDPLSRGANEWERYAAQLAAAGRLREAIRAWYHAVLVTLYGANVLQFRKGRTNWEYLAMLGPEIPWRPDLVHLTRRFEEEWYGSDQSSADALDECRDAARSILNAVRRAKREAA